MTDVTAELLPEHPILALTSSETNKPLGLFAGEVIAFRCVECGCADEDIREMIHEADCSLAGQTAPTAYADRRDTEAFPYLHQRDVATDGGLK